MGRRTSYWSSMLTRLGGKRSFASSTTPKMKQFAATVDADQPSSKIGMTGEFAPLYVMGGLVLAAAIMATHTAKQQLMHSPTVFVSKKKRESVPEVGDPDVVISSADKFVNKSFLRKVGHIQEDNRTLPILPP